MDADGKNQTRLTKNEVSDSEPAWSPDGKKIAFISDRDIKDIFEIYVMDADGKNQARLTNNESSVYMPTWSPDGKRIAFCLNRDGKEKRVKDKDDTSEIYVMGADGKNQVRLTNNKAGDTNTKPTWSPDGTKIAFCLSRCGTHEIYVIDADGKNQTRLTTGNWSAEGPAWCPVSLPEIAALFSPDTKEK
jgi:Tol biopolymer transport system component